MAHHSAGALLPPSLVAQVEDEDAEREKDDDPGDGEGGRADKASCGGEALVCKIIRVER